MSLTAVLMGRLPRQRRRECAPPSKVSHHSSHMSHSFLLLRLLLPTSRPSSSNSSSSSFCSSSSWLSSLRSAAPLVFTRRRHNSHERGDVAARHASGLADKQNAERVRIDTIIYQRKTKADNKKKKTVADLPLTRREAHGRERSACC